LKGEEKMPVEGIRKTATYLTFTLGEEVFAVDVQKVREVLDFTSITKVPRTPDFMRGVINLRGSVVPVIDMRLKFGMEVTEETVDTCVIVMEVRLDDETTVIGALADSVKEVFDLDPEQIEPPPRIGTSLNTEFIHGMGKHNEQFIIILDIDRVFSADELTLVGAAGMQPAKAGEGEEESSAAGVSRQEQQA
jgi:purine-binding chemotaxis protein CheW